MMLEGDFYCMFNKYNKYCFTQLKWSLKHDKGQLWLGGMGLVCIRGIELHLRI